MTSRRTWLGGRRIPTREFSHFLICRSFYLLMLPRHRSRYCIALSFPLARVPRRRLLLSKPYARVQVEHTRPQRLRVKVGSAFTEPTVLSIWPPTAKASSSTAAPSCGKIFSLSKGATRRGARKSEKTNYFCEPPIVLQALKIQQVPPPQR